MCEECQIIAWATFLSRLTRSSVVGNEWKKLFAWEISILFLGHSSAFRFGTCNIHFQLLQTIQFKFVSFSHSSSKMKSPFHYTFMLLPLNMRENTVTPTLRKLPTWNIYYGLFTSYTASDWSSLLRHKSHLWWTNLSSEVSKRDLFFWSRSGMLDR